MTGVATIVIEGAIYGDWKEVAVSRSLGEAAASFSLSVTEADYGVTLSQARIRPGDSCEVLLDGIKVITGHIDVVQRSYDDQSHGVEVSGRSKTADLVDSAPEVKGGQMRGYHMPAIAEAIADGFDVEIDARHDGDDPFEDVQVWPGDTAWNGIERLARQRGLLAHDDEEGRLVIERLDPEAGAVAALIEGVNIHAASSTIRADQRHSEYVVKGQRPGTDEAFGEEAAHLEARARDVFVRRHRPLVIVAEEPGDRAAMRKRADWEASVRAGESIEASVTVVGWQRAPGALWKAGETYRVTSPMLAIDLDLVCKSVRYLQDDSQGTKTEMTLVPPEALTPEPAAPKPASASQGSTPATEDQPGGQSFTVEDVWSNTKPGEPAI